MPIVALGPFGEELVLAWVAVVASSFVVDPAWVAVAVASSFVVARPFGLASVVASVLVLVLVLASTALASGFAVAAAAPPFALAFQEVAGLASAVVASSSFGVAPHQPAPAFASAEAVVAAGTVPFGDVVAAVVVVASSFEEPDSGLASSVPAFAAAATAASLVPEWLIDL